MSHDIRRFLVTAPFDLRMDLWAATAMMTNWLEGRDIRDGRQTWLVMCAGNPSGFIQAAENIGITVEEIKYVDGVERYEILVGRPGSGWYGTCWENRRSKSTIRGLSTTWPTNAAECCNADAPCPDAQCSRELGHPGRHIASLGPAWGHRVVAAWPGIHPPRKNDLT